MRGGKGKGKWGKKGEKKRPEEGKSFIEMGWKGKEREANGAIKSITHTSSPTNPEILAVKRVIALEGDTVVTKPPYPSPHEDVPVGHVWIEGDQVDGNKTMDSNRVGPVSRSLIVGRVGGVVWPWRKAGRIRWEDWRGSERVLVGNRTVEEYTFFD